MYLKLFVVSVSKAAQIGFPGMHILPFDPDRKWTFLTTLRTGSHLVYNSSVIYIPVTFCMRYAWLDISEQKFIAFAITNGGGASSELTRHSDDTVPADRSKAAKFPR